jgi:hypothetical protein
VACVATTCRACVRVCVAVAGVGSVAAVYVHLPSNGVPLASARAAFLCAAHTRADLILWHVRPPAELPPADGRPALPCLLSGRLRVRSSARVPSPRV